MCEPAHDGQSHPQVILPLPTTDSLTLCCHSLIHALKTSCFAGDNNMEFMMTVVMGSIGVFAEWVSQSGIKCSGDICVDGCV